MNKIKNIVVVVDSIDVDDSSGSKVNVALIQNLQTLGYHIEVFHYTRKDIQLRGVVCHSIKEKKYNLKYLLSRSQRVFTRFTKININRFIEGIIGFSFTFFNDVDSIRSFVLNNLKKQPDLIITISKGASFRPHYALLKLPKFHDKWLAYVHDPYPFHCYPAPYDWFEPGYKIKEAFFRGVSEKSKFSANYMKETIFDPIFMEDLKKIILLTMDKTDNDAFVEKYKITKFPSVLFFDEDVPGGASAYILNEILNTQNAYAHLDSKPQTLTAQHHRPAYGTDGDYFSKPSADDIFENVYNVMHEMNPVDFPKLR